LELNTSPAFCRHGPTMGAKQLPLDDSWLSVFHGELVRNFPVWQLAEPHVDLGSGRLSVWVPEHMNSLPPQKLRQSLNPQEDFGEWETMCAFFDQHLRNDPSRLIIADTYNSLQDIRFADRMEVPWFSVEAASSEQWPRVCAYITGAQTNVTAYDNLLNSACSYPQTLILTSGNEVPHSGQHFAVDSKILQAFGQRVEHIMIGVFDACSMMIWSRFPVC